MSRTSRFAGGVSLGYLNQILATIIGLWITPFLFQRIGQNNYGLWLVGAQILLYMTLMDFGIVALLPREIGFITGRAQGWRSEELPALSGQTLRLLLAQVPLLACAGVALWFAMPQGWAPLRNPLGMVMIAFTALFPLRIFPAILQGLQDLVFVGSVQVVAAMLYPLLAAALVYAGWGLGALALAWTAGQVLVTVLCWLRIRRVYPGVLPSRLPRFDRQSSWSLLKRGFWVTVSQVAQVLLNGTDMVIIARVFGPAAVVPYAFTGKLITVLANQPQLLMQSAGPALSEMRAGESTQRQLQACNALSQATMLASGAVACVVMLVNRGFVSWWTGPAQYGGFLLCTLLLVNMLLRHWNNPLVYAVFCFGGERRLALTTFFDGLVTFSGTLLLVRFIGLAGAPLAAIAGACLISLPGNLGKLSSETGERPWDLMIPLKPWAVRFVPLALAAAAIQNYWTPNNPFALAAAVAGAGVVYAAVMLPAALRDPLGIYLRPALAAGIQKIRGAFAQQPEPCVTEQQP